MVQFNQVVVVGSDHALHHAGDRLLVVDNEAEARAAPTHKVFRREAEDGVKAGRYRAVGSWSPGEYEEFLRQRDAAAVQRKTDADAAAVRLGEEQAQRAAAAAERRRELAAWFEGLTTDDMLTVLSWDPGEQDGRRRAAVTKFNALPTERQQALIERATGGR